MSKTFKLAINWTRSAIALALLCAVFSFSAMAQDNPNTPLDEKSVAALIEELTGGLPDLIEDEEQVTAITGKWEAHQGLTGKTRTQILGMLFADVKSIVKVKETQDSIWANWNESASEDTEVNDSDDNAGKQPVTPVTRPDPVTPQPVVPVTREFVESNIEVQRLGSYIDGPYTVVGAYFAASYEATPVCVRPPGSRFTNGPCVKVQELKIPPGSPPEYLCEIKEGKGNCREFNGRWIAKTCKYGYSYFIWQRTSSEGGGANGFPTGRDLICTSGKTPVPGEPLP